MSQLLAERDPTRIRQALWHYYTACADANMPETTRLATTIETWWPAILVDPTEDVTNARSEAFNRVIKQVKRVACGFRNMDNAIEGASWPTSQSLDRDYRQHDEAPAQVPRAALGRCCCASEA